MHQLQRELLQLLPVRPGLPGYSPCGIVQLQLRLRRLVLQRQPQLLQAQLRQQLLRVRAGVPLRLPRRVVQLQFQLPGFLLQRQPVLLQGQRRE